MLSLPAPLLLLPLLPNPILAANTGKATFYGGNLKGGTCSFTTLSTLPSGLYGTALDGPQWSSSANCGRCVSISTPSAPSTKIKAMILDSCPECESNHLDLFPDAFKKLADPSKGIIDIVWEYVDCGIAAPLSVHLKSGVSRYWFSAQVVGANQGVSSLQVSTDSGKTWQSGLTRQTYNFFEKTSGFGTDTVWVKAVSMTGKEVVIKNVAVKGDNVVQGPSNF